MRALLSKLNEPYAMILAAIIGAVGIALGGYFAIRAAQEPVRLSIAATQTAEMRLTTEAVVASTQTAEALLVSVPSATPAIPSSTNTPADTPTPIPTPTLTASHTPISSTDTPTVTSPPPSDTPTSIPLPPTSTSTPTPAPTVTLTPLPSDTPEPTATQTPDEKTFDVLYDFSDSPDCFEAKGDISPSIRNGVLSLNGKSTGSYIDGEFHPCLNDMPIRVVETKVTMHSNARYHGSAGLQASLKYDEGQGWWFEFGLSDNGDIFLAQAKDGEYPDNPEKEWSGGGLDNPHVLRVEWTGEEVRFFADGEFLMSLPSDDPGWWVALSASANYEGETNNAFDWVGWIFHK